MNYCTDLDLLPWEPNLFDEMAFSSQVLMSGTGDLAGTIFTVDAGSLEASHVTAGQVIVLTGGTSGTYPIVSVDSATQLSVSVLYDGLFPLSASPDPSPIGTAADLSFSICTFSAQSRIVSDWMLQAADVDVSDGSGVTILKADALRRPCVAGTLAMIFSALAVGDDREAHREKANLYERLFQRLIRLVELELDTDGDGVVDERRALNVVALQRA